MYKQNLSRPNFVTSNLAFVWLFTIYSKHPFVVTYKLYWNKPSVTIKFLFFTEFSIEYDMFRPIWPSSSNTQYVQSMWEAISNMKFYETGISFLH